MNFIRPKLVLSDFLFVVALHDDCGCNGCSDNHGILRILRGSMAIAFLIPLVCYGVIGGYALSKRSASSLAKK